MENENKRKVLIGAVGTSDRSVLRHSVIRALEQRNEVPDFTEIKTANELVQALNNLKESLVELVVVQGFDGYTYRIFHGISQLAENITAIFINENEDILSQAKGLGFETLERSKLLQLEQIINEALDKKS